MKIAYIEWLDSSILGNENIAIADLNKMNGERLFTAGILISADAQAVRIAQDVYENGEMCRTIEVIPRVVITKFKEIDL